MNVGELGNFISYAFAPASVVAPLGTVSGIGVGPIARSDLCLVCLDRQLFLCATLIEGTLSEGKRAQIPRPRGPLTRWFLGRIPGDLHRHSGCCHCRVLGQYL